MSDTKHHRHNGAETKSKPFYKNWLTLSGIILIVVFAIFLGHEFIVQLPKAKQTQAQLEIEFKSIVPLPNVSVVRYSASHKTGQALVETTYLTDMNPTVIFDHYDSQLKQHGWQSYSTSGMTDWGRDLGGKSAYYCKSEYSAQLQYAGQQANYGWTYAFSISWGLGECKTETKSDWVKHTVPVSLLFIVFGSFFAFKAGDIGRNAWTKDEIEYRKWIRKRNRIKSEKSLFSFVPKSYSLWNDRILSIAGFIIGLFVIWVGAFSLWRNIFGG